MFGETRKKRFPVDGVDDRSILPQVSAGVTKERILDAAEELMLERSFHSVGLNQILSAVNVPKGSFYHYFDSKEQFGVEMLRHYGSRAAAHKRQMLSNREVEPDPVQRLLLFFNSVTAGMAEDGWKWPCLMLKLAAEVSDFSEPMRAELAKGFANTLAILEETLDEAVAQGSLPKDLNTAAEAAFILDLWNGSVQRALIYRSMAPLRHAISFIQHHLTPTP